MLIFNDYLQQTTDILYYEVLDIPLPELQGLKTLKVAFHHATKDEVGLLAIISSVLIIMLGLAYLSKTYLAVIRLQFIVSDSPKIAL